MSFEVHDTEPKRLQQRRLAAGLVLAAFCLIGAAAVILGWVFAWVYAAGFVLVCTLLSPLAARLLNIEPGVPVLTYHSVSKDASWLPWAKEISIRPSSLDRHLRLLHRMGLKTMDTAEYVALRRDGKPNPTNVVLLHFDDGYLDNWVAAWPILEKHSACATMFVSTDFIAPDQPLRPRQNQSEAPKLDGYLTWAELRALDNSPEWSIECHGTDHGRVPTGPVQTGAVSAENVGREAWLQWRKMPGSKHDWYLTEDWPVPLGSKIPESAPALSARSFSGGQLEPLEVYEDRVRRSLREARAAIRENLGRAPTLFCWPQNITNPRARALAAEAGFLATTGGQGRNIETGDARVLARVHVGEDYAGFRSGRLDDIALRAHIRCMQGYLIWAPVLVGIGALKRVTSRRKARRTKALMAQELEKGIS